MNSKRKSARGSSNNDTSIRQAELILRLYELRRETIMREARSYVGGEFLPASADELIAIVSAGGRHCGLRGPRPGAHRSPHRSHRGSRLHHLGRRPAKVSRGVRSPR